MKRAQDECWLPLSHSVNSGVQQFTVKYDFFCKKIANFLQSELHKSYSLNRKCQSCESNGKFLQNKGFLHFRRHQSHILFLRKFTAISAEIKLATSNLVYMQFRCVENHRKNNTQWSEHDSGAMKLRNSLYYF